LILEESEIALKEGIEYLGNYKHDLALKEFQKVVKDHPEAGIAWLYLGDALLFLDKIEKAQAAHKKAVKYDGELGFPRMLSAPAREGMEHTVMFGDFNGKALSPGEAAIVIEEPIPLQRTLSLLSLGSGLQIQAGILASSYIELFGSLLEADISRMKAELVKDSSRFGLWREYAINLELMEKQDEAIEAYAKALTLDPRDRQCQRGLARTTMFKRNGIMYSRFAQHQTVIDDVKKMREKDPQVVERAKKKPADVLLSIEIVQITGNSGYVRKEYSKKKQRDPLVGP